MEFEDEQDCRSSGPCKVLLVDDHPIAQTGLKSIFARSERYEIVGVLDNGAPVSAFVRSQEVDLVLLDMNMPGLRGINVLAEIVGSNDMTVIILTGETQFQEIEYALKLGARGAVSKTEPPAEILSACDAALDGKIYLSPVMRKGLAAVEDPAIVLSPRQMAILHYLAQGETNKEISYRLSIAQPTVSFHIAELRRKLDVPSNRKIVERAQELGLL